MKKKAWSGRFQVEETPLMESFNNSFSVDYKLYPFDIQGSLAHTTMLYQQKLLTKAELTQIHHGLKQILKEFENKTFKIDPKLEDIHMAVESRLAELIGPVAGKIHTARSRNDQVALDSRLYTRHTLKLMIAQLHELINSFFIQAQEHKKTILPGYTHLQRAQPVLLAHHLLCYFEMFWRDCKRFMALFESLDECPLGAGALAGTTFPIDRHFVSDQLGFSRPTANSLDSVADRDYMVEFMSHCALTMTHLSRLSEELILWSSQEFHFITLPQGYCTGSSMMPQKINPDAPELIRGKTGRVLGNLINLFVTLKSLPLAYNKDLQEDKPALFDSAETLLQCLEIMTEVIKGTRFHKEKMLEATEQGFLQATDVADYLAFKGLPFREAHEVAGKLVHYGLENKKTLNQITLTEYQKFSKLFDKDIFDKIDIEYLVAQRKSFGGTSPSEVTRQLREAQKKIKVIHKFMKEQP